MSYPSIPDNIYNNRCRYCKLFTGLPNTVGEISTTQAFNNKDTTPCKIFGIADFNKVYGECLSFTPNFGYPGICQSCKYFDIWLTKSNYCELSKKENADRHPMFIGNKFSCREPCELDYIYQTCSKWQLSYLWYDTAVKLTAEGRLPKTWDLNTSKLIDEQEWICKQEEIAEKPPCSSQFWFFWFWW